MCIASHRRKRFSHPWSTLNTRHKILSHLTAKRLNFPPFVFCIFQLALNIKALSLRWKSHRRQVGESIWRLPGGRNDDRRKCWHSWENVLIICVKSWQLGRNQEKRRPNKKRKMRLPHVWKAKLLFSTTKCPKLIGQGLSRPKGWGNRVTKAKQQRQRARWRHKIFKNIWD